MNPLSNNIHVQYQGYLDTPLLWKDHAILGIEQLHVISSKTPTFMEGIPDKLVLGKRVEQFVFKELEQSDSIEVLLKNTQVQNGKTTIGEIDCMLKQNDRPIHLEIVYKFYLYDPDMGENEIDCWIGPNRNDTLLKKLSKLKDKQFPLIHNNHTRPILDKLDLDASEVLQRVRFKGQLFTPYHTDVAFKLLNQDCLKGFYIHVSKTNQFSDSTFYIPAKADWLLEIQTDVEWMIYDEFKKSTTTMIDQKRAPLCLIKFPEGKLQKFFVVWWS